MSDPIIMLDSAGNPLSVGMAVLWKGHGRRDFRPGWVRDIIIDGGKPAVRVDDGAEWDADLKGRTWSSTEWIDEPKRIQPRREQPKPDPRIAALAAEVERLRRVLAVESGDESAAPPGWMRPYGGRSWANAGPGVRPQWQVVQEHDGTWWYIYVNNGRHFSKERLKFALEAMEAADRAGGSDV